MQMSAAAERPALPREIYFEATNRCNLQCRACIRYRGNWEAERDMSLEDLQMVTAQLPGLERAVLHGIGEPLLNPALPGMIRHLKARNVRVCFNSNGTLLDEERQADLMDSGLDELRISLDAASPSGYRAMRGSDRFEEIVRNLLSFTALRKIRGAGTPLLSLWYLGTQDSIAELPDFVRLAADIGIDQVYLQRLVYFQEGAGYGIARSGRSLQDGRDGSLESIRKSQDLAAALGVRFNASGLDSPVDSLQSHAGSAAPWRKCCRPATLLYISANGNVLPCCIAPFATMDYSSIILGNVFETSLVQIWTGSAYRHFRERRRSGPAPKCCRGCGILWSL